MEIFLTNRKSHMEIFLTKRKSPMEIFLTNRKSPIYTVKKLGGRKYAS